MTPQEPRDRTAKFAKDVHGLAAPLLRRIEARQVAEQLIDASGPVASNYRAAGRARSHAEFTAKIGSVPVEVGDLIAEAQQLVAIFTKSNQTARRDEGLRRPPPRCRGRSR